MRVPKFLIGKEFTHEEMEELIEFFSSAELREEYETAKNDAYTWRYRK